MIRIFWIYIYTFLFFSGSIFSSITLGKELETENYNVVTKDYLKQLPINDYILGPGDTLRVVVSQLLPDLTSEVSIDGEGTIYLPRLNRIYVEGLNISELNSVLNEAYKEFINFPSVETTVIFYRPLKILVQGEVESPGLKTLRGSFSVDDAGTKTTDDYFFPTVFDAIQASGGITEYADLSKVKIIRKDSISNGGGKISTILNFADFLNNGDNIQNIRIYNSDTIIVNKAKNSNKSLLSKAILSDLNSKYMDVLIVGRVANPGKITLSRVSVLNDGIDFAGGAKIFKGPITFLRFNNDGTIDKRKFRLNKKAKRGSYKNPTLKDGDLIFVGESLLSISTEVLSEITSPFLGVYSTYGLIKAIND